ncbi:MAG: enoyl-CoA hydratase/isomerase family protein [Acidobacteria bacterium]|nr:MAG: enoyl-CoA hydratase/isomerase family protein [Acidobacteriota bacterium]
MQEEAQQPPTHATSSTTPKKGYQFIRWDDASTVARLTMARPPQNVMSIEMLKEMAEAIERLNHREDVRLILLESTAECEGYFSMGLGVEGYTEQLVFQMMDAFHSVFRAMMDVSKPVLAVVDGVASGAGAELAAFCDLVIASERAQFRQPEIKLGVFPPLGAVVYPRVIGPRRAMEFLLTGEPINARTALEIGLVNRVVPPADLEATVDAMVRRITDESSPVLQLLKRVIFNGTWMPFAEALKRAQDIYLNQLFELEDSQEGLRALLEKRKPVWKNR